MIRSLIALTVGVVLVVQLGFATSAGADGLPLPVTASPGGVSSPGGEDRYVALGAERGTVIARVDQQGGEVIRSKPLADELAVPAVAYDGSPSGLSADGTTLVLIRPRAGFPRAETRFAVLGARQLRLRELVTLRGDFSFDAISPDGSRIYLIEYLSRTDPSRYEVRAYDVRSGRLLRDPIVDPNEPPGEMRGYPITRATSPAGRWAYTLYDGGGDHPFIHALDTLGGRAVCIDVHPLADHPDLRNIFAGNADRFELAISGDGGGLTVVHREEPVAYVDTQTFEVSVPSDPLQATGFPWLVVGLVPIALAAMWALSRGLHRRRHRIAPGGAG